MYIPHSYRNENISEIEEFIRKNSFAILVSQVDGAPWATHIPLELEHNKDGTSKLVGHLAKANDQSQSLSPGEEVLAIFNGPHSYVSSSWYKDEEVPTWNYIAVHVYGKVKIQTPQELRDSLKKLVDKYEANSEQPISVDSLSTRTMRQVRGIIGVEISIDKIQAAYKLSQGRKHDHERIIRELEHKADAGSKAIAAEMQKRNASDKFSDKD